MGIQETRDQGDTGIRESQEQGDSGIRDTQESGNQEQGGSGNRDLGTGGFSNQGDLGIREAPWNAPGPAVCPDPGSCWMFSRISAPSHGSWSAPVPTIPAAPDIPGILSAWECWTRIPKEAPGPELPRGMSSSWLRIPWGWFLCNSGMCCPFQRLGKPRAFPKVLFYHQEPVPSSFSLNVGKILVFPWKFLLIHKYYQEWDLSRLEETWINVELSGMASMLGTLHPVRSMNFQVLFAEGWRGLG